MKRASLFLFILLSIITVSQAATVVISPKDTIQRDNRSLIPLRHAAEKLGATVSYDQADRSITITLGNTTVFLWPNNTYAYINSDVCSLEVPPIVRKGVTYVPIRFVAEALGASVQWSRVTKNITIATSASSSAATSSSTPIYRPSPPITYTTPSTPRVNKTESVSENNETVYTTRTGECYHRSSCSSLRKSKFPTTVSQAKRDGYRPCQRCYPPG